VESFGERTLWFEEDSEPKSVEAQEHAGILLQASKSSIRAKLCLISTQGDLTYFEIRIEIGWKFQTNFNPDLSNYSHIVSRLGGRGAVQVAIMGQPLSDRYRASGSPALHTGVPLTFPYDIRVAVSWIGSYIP
jgi:hypothetical protein